MTGGPSSHPHHPSPGSRQLSEIEPRPACFRSWERIRQRRVHWLAECLAEMFGVFFYCYAGLGATAAYTIGNILKLPNVGSIFTIGFGYGLGIVVALVVCTATSGGHFSPAVTTVHLLFNGFPPAKAIRYIISQVFGGFMAAMFVYWQWNTLIKDAEAVLRAAGLYETENFSVAGPAGIFALFANPGAHLGLVFLNEFVSDFFIGIVISACLDPTNFFTPPAAVPWLIGLTYGAAIWGFASNGVALNTARDVGGRLAALAIWGSRASGGRYAAIAALTNIPATLSAYAFYEFVFKDSTRVLTVIGKEFHDSYTAQREQREYHNDDVTIGPGPGSDAEKGIGVDRLKK